MRNIGFTVASFATPLIYIYWMTQNDRYEPEPKTLVAYLFAWGIIAGIVSTYFNPRIAAYIGIGGAAFIEEPLKLLGQYLMSTGRKTGYEMNNHLDGMVYGAAAGAGFAALENIYYISDMVMRQGSPILSRDTVQGHNLLLPHSLDSDRWTVVGVGQSTKRLDTLD